VAVPQAVATEAMLVMIGSSAGDRDDFDRLAVGGDDGDRADAQGGDADVPSASTANESIKLVIDQGVEKLGAAGAGTGAGDPPGRRRPRPRPGR